MVILKDWIVQEVVYDKLFQRFLPLYLHRRRRDLARVSSANLNGRPSFSYLLTRPQEVENELDVYRFMSVTLTIFIRL